MVSDLFPGPLKDFFTYFFNCQQENTPALLAEASAKQGISPEELLKLLAQEGWLAENPKNSLFIVVKDIVLTHKDWFEARFIVESLKERSIGKPSTTHQAAIVEIAKVLTLNTEQSQALQAMAEQKLHFLTGGPGTGKSRVLAGWWAYVMTLAAGSKTHHRVAFVAPTGKAVDRLHEVCIEALALFPQLKPYPYTKGQPFNSLNFAGEWLTLDHLLLSQDKPNLSIANRRLDYDWVVLDEASMASISHLYRLLHFLPAHTHVVLAGDPDQLSAVQGGDFFAAVLKNFTNQPPLRANTSHLAYNQRQKKDLGLAPLIKVLSERQAKLANFQETHTGLTWEDNSHIPLQWEKAWQEWAEKLCEQSNPAHALSLLGQRMILTFQRRYTGSGINSSAINQKLQRFYHPKDPYHGLPFLVTENNYLIGLKNGERGIFLKQDGELMAFLAGQEQPRSLKIKELKGIWEPAYATTVHKAQGSEFDEVWLLLAEPGSSLNRYNLLYTGISRAKTHVHMLGSSVALNEALDSTNTSFSNLDLFF